MLSKMSTIESRTGRTKHALSIPSSRPAFISVGEFGMNRPLTIRSKKRSSQLCRSASPPPYISSTLAIAAATRRKSSPGVSMHSPASFFLR